MLGVMARNFTLALAGVLNSLLTIYFWVVLISVLLTWVNPDPRNPIVRFFRAATEPVLWQVRRWLPFVVVGRIDLSPLAVMLLIEFLRMFLVRTLYQLADRLALAGTALVG